VTESDSTATDPSADTSDANSSDEETREEPAVDLGLTETETEAETEAEPTEPPPPRIEKYFRAVVKMGGSDLHFKANAPGRVRLRGKLRSLSGKPLSNARIERMLYEIMTDEQKENYERNGSTDFAYQLGDSDRFRINIFRQRGLSSMAARRVSREILDFTQLRLPEAMFKLADFHAGLILLSGVTGSGKSTTIAAALDYINATRPCHIVTLEDPIEYLFEDKKAFINQREIGIDVADFPSALKYLMREDPDVVLIGEMRDAETFHAALHAAETGHLVFGTVHASGAAQTVTRVLDLLPEASRDLIRQTLVFNLNAVVCQKLLPSIKEGVGRVPCVEIMFSNPSVRKLIGDKREDELPDLLKSCYNEGMMDFNECLYQLLETEFISMNVALAASPNPDELRMRLKGIRTGASGLIG